MPRPLFLLTIALCSIGNLSAQVTLTEAVLQLQNTDFADQNTWLYPDFNRDSNRIEVTKSVGDCKKQIAFINPTTAAITFSDTLETAPRCRRMREMVAASELVIEGECLEQGAAYRKTAGDWPEAYTPHLIKVFKVFKGDLKTDTIVVIRYGGRLPDGKEVDISDGQISLPSPGSRAILFLSPIPEVQYHKAGVHLDAYPKWAANDYPIKELSPDYSSPWYTLHVEDNLYKELEKSAGASRRIIGHPTWSTAELSNLNIEEKWHQEPALYYNFISVELEEGKPDTLSVHLSLQSGLDNTYPTSGEVQLRYNPAAFGRRVLTNKLTRATQQINNFHVGKDGIYRAFFPGYYRVYAEDLNDSTLLIRFQCKDLKKQPVMLPMGDPQIFFDLFFSIKNYKANTGFKLVPTANKKRQRRFDYETKRIVPYRIVQSVALPDVPLSYFLKPEIHRIYPDTVVAGSGQVVTVEGKWLLAETTLIGVRCAQGHYFIKPEQIIEYTDDRLRYTISTSAVSSTNQITKMPTGVTHLMVVKQAGHSEQSSYTDYSLFIK